MNFRIRWSWILYQYYGILVSERRWVAEHASPAQVLLRDERAQGAACLFTSWSWVDRASDIVGNELQNRLRFCFEEQTVFFWIKEAKDPGETYESHWSARE